MEIVVEEIDNDTKSIVNDWVITVDGTDQLKEMLGLKCEEILRPVYMNVAKKNLNKLQRSSGQRFQISNKKGTIREKNEMDNLPYKCHTNRELLLMLRGIKPLSFFCSRDLSGADKQYNNQPFQRFVKNKVIIKFKKIIYDRDIEGKLRETGILYVIYTLPGEEWRAKTLILLKETHSHCKWSEGMERIEGSLLGYTDEQNDYYIKNVYSRTKRPLIAN